MEKVYLLTAQQLSQDRRQGSEEREATVLEFPPGWHRQHVDLQSGFRMQLKKDLAGGASLLRGQVWVAATVLLVGADADAAAVLSLPGVAAGCSPVRTQATRRRTWIRDRDRRK